MAKAILLYHKILYGGANPINSLGSIQVRIVTSCTVPILQLLPFIATSHSPTHSWQINVRWLGILRAKSCSEVMVKTQHLGSIHYQHYHSCDSHVSTPYIFVWIVFHSSAVHVDVNQITNVVGIECFLLVFICLIRDEVEHHVNCVDLVWNLSLENERTLWKGQTFNNEKSDQRFPPKLSFKQLNDHLID